MPGIAGLHDYPAFGIKVFNPAQSYDLKKALQADSSDELHEDMLSDARDSLIQGDLRHVVLEMAIVCEVLAKELCSRKNITVGHETVLMILNTVLKKAK